MVTLMIKKPPPDFTTRHCQYQTSTPFTTAIPVKVSKEFLHLIQDYEKTQYNYTITAVCENGVCGGLGDRLKNLLNVIAIGIVTQRNFRVSYTKDFDLETFYAPTTLPWNSVPVNSNVTTSINCIDKPCSCILTALSSNKHNIRLSANSDCVNFIIRSIGNENNPLLHEVDFRSYLFDRWFNKTVYFQSMLYDTFEGQTLAVHMRIGGGPDAVRLHPYYIEKTSRSYANCLTSIAPGMHDLFVSSDSQLAISHLMYEIGCSKNFIITNNIGQLGHVERLRTADSDARMFVDFELLRNASVILTAPSGFSTLAVLMRKHSNQIAVRGDTCEWTFNSFTTSSAS